MLSYLAAVCQLSVPLLGRSRQSWLAPSRRDPRGLWHQWFPAAHTTLIVISATTQYRHGTAVSLKDLYQQVQVLVVSVRLHHCPVGRNYHEDQSVLTGQIDSETSLGCVYTGRQFELCLWYIYAMQLLTINWWNCTFIRRESCNWNLCIQIKASFF